jgi:hydroxypyruvate isomerase
LLERFAASKAAGFNPVELLFSYDANSASLCRILPQAGQQMVQIDTPPPDWAGKGRFFAAIPGGAVRFQRHFKRALPYA